jgi:formate dehydrogenase major subunit
MTPTCEFADVVLPASSFLEKSGTFTNGERRVQRVNAVMKPVEGTKPDGVIIAEIMQRMGMDQPDYTPEGVLAEIAQIVPFFKGATWENLTEQRHPVAHRRRRRRHAHPPPRQLQARPRQVPLLRVPRVEGDRETRRRVSLHPHHRPHPRALQLRHHDPPHRQRDIVSEDLLAIHPEDAAKKGIEDGDLVRIYSARGEVRIKARVSTEVKPGILYTTFHFPEALVNMVTSSECDEDTMCPEYKVVAVEVERVACIPQLAPLFSMS